MSKGNSLMPLLPPIKHFDFRSVPHIRVYIAAAGFEDRATAVLDRCILENAMVEKAFLIEYKPHGDPRNRVSEFMDKLRQIGASVSCIAYDRRNPQEFQTRCLSLFRSIDSSEVIVDISGMSKFLIMVVLQSLRKVQNELTIVYAEADIYHPTKEEFERETKKSGTTPDFLTTGVYDILTVSSLSSVSMQGYPILMLAFPTFNHFEIAALHNEFSPQNMILLEGEPHEEQDKWRLQGIREVNKNALSSPDYASESKVLSTFDYRSNVEAFEEIYRRYSYSHKILVSPTGSKLQTLAVFMFKQLHPDIQIVYPITEAFIGEYSEKCRALWAIHLGRFCDFVETLDSYRFHKR